MLCELIIITCVNIRKIPTTVPNLLHAHVTLLIYVYIYSFLNDCKNCVLLSALYTHTYSLEESVVLT